MVARVAILVAGCSHERRAPGLELVWRYLAAASKPEGAVSSANRIPEISLYWFPGPELDARCAWNWREREKIQVRGTDRDLMGVNLKGDDFDCALCLDKGEQDRCKLIGVAMPADDAEVRRD